MTELTDKEIKELKDYMLHLQNCSNEETTMIVDGMLMKHWLKIKQSLDSALSSPEKFLQLFLDVGGFMESLIVFISNGNIEIAKMLIREWEKEFLEQYETFLNIVKSVKNQE